MGERKVFGIGFHKTGTSSLGDALTVLGYRVTGPFGMGDPRIGENALALATEIVPRFDAFQDNPWPIIFRELDEKYPGSKFVLTVRPAEDWIRSQVRHFGKNETEMRKWIYRVGCPAGNERVYLERYERHNRDVRAHFSGRSEDLVELRITDGDGWEKLCPFLGHPVPETEFPHSNKAAERERKASWSVRSLRRLKRRLGGR